MHIPCIRNMILSLLVCESHLSVIKFGLIKQPRRARSPDFVAEPSKQKSSYHSDAGIRPSLDLHEMLVPRVADHAVIEVKVLVRSDLKLAVEPVIYGAIVAFDSGDNILGQFAKITAWDGTQVWDV